MTIQEFAKRLKTKYPEYGNLEDQDLVDRVLVKFPEYQKVLDKPQPTQPLEKSKLATFFNKAGSALNWSANNLLAPTVNALQTGIMQPIREAQRIVPGGKTGRETYKTPFGTLRNTRDQSIAKTVMQAVDVASAGLPVQKAILKPAAMVGKLFSGAVKRLGGTITGKGVEVIERVLKNPQVAKIGLRGQDTEVLKNTAKAARDAVIDLSRQANKEYEQALDALPKRLGRIPQEATAQAKSIIKIGGQKVALTKQGFKAYLTETLRDFGVKVNAKKAEFDFTESPLRVSEENILKEVFDVIQAWKDTSPKGLNRLAVKIGNYRKPGDQSDALNSIIGGLKNNIRKYIGKRVPAVKELNDRYMQREDFIDALRAELSIPNNIKTTEGIIKTSRKIEQLFNSNKELARELVEQLQGLQKFDILSAEAGRQLAQAPSRAQVTIGDSFRGFVQTVIPPRAIGEIAATTGIATQKIKPLITHLQNLSVPERIAVFSFFTDLFESLDESAGPDSNQ